MSSSSLLRQCQTGFDRLTGLVCETRTGVSILLYLVKLYPIKMDIIRDDSLPKPTVLNTVT